jgi:FtsP/CotA-like multicopper oxidase with cupredoxin domain
MFSRREFLGASLATCAISAVRAQPIAPPTILRLERRNIEVNGKAASVLDIRQPGGALGVETEVGRAFRVRVENRLSEPSLIHWHGLTPPWRQDGVPNISSPPISPGEDADFDFPLAFDGTFFMHSHQGLQEQLLMSAPLIIRSPNDPSRQEIVVELADFSFRTPEEIYEDLRKPDAADPMKMGSGAKSAEAGGADMGRMDMSSGGGKMADMPRMDKPGMGKPAMKMGDGAKPDLNDVKYDAFLANRRSLEDPDVVKVEAGGVALLRFINGSSMSAYHVDLGEIDGELVAVDGHRVAPIRARRFPIAVAQRLDISVTFPKGAATYPVLAILEGERNQAGIILVAGDAVVRRIPALGDAASPPLTLDLESHLRAAQPLAPRTADRVHTLNLTGDMSGYLWSINGVAYTEATPTLPVAAGERVELVFANQTMMPHPMHLHGHVFQVVAINGERFLGAMRDTVLVPPAASVTVAFDADNPGWWALHCHLLYHMEAGMFTTVRYV